MVAVKQEPVVVSLKLLVDDKIKRVVAAEANKDFVDILFSFLTLPMGTIIRLTSSSTQLAETPVSIGCMNKIYQGVENLDREYWQTEHCKTMLLNPRNSLVEYCKKLNINIDDSGSEFKYGCPRESCLYYSMYRNVSCGCGSGKTTEERKPVEKRKRIEENVSSREGAFLKGGIVFIISDDLQVRPASPAVLAQLIPDIGSREGSNIREMRVEVSRDEVVCLFAHSLVSETPLSDVFLAKLPGYARVGTQRKPPKLGTILSSSTTAAVDTAERNGPSLELKLTFVKSTKKILYAEATNKFFDFLCSFLTIPVGSMIHVLERQSGLKCLDNLYTSVLELEQKWFHSSNKCGLLNPNIAAHHNCKKQPLRSVNTSYTYTRSYYYDDEPEMIDPRGDKKKFAVKPSLFLVPDDLEVKPLSVASCLLILNELEIPFDQTEEQQVTVGMKEAMSLLKAALTSPSSALTKGLGPFLQKQKP
ncbi:unnamed protein product [Cuscuta epithymum]|uniref:DUF674 family protein n=1 Tax=Cuscuta epithymum TaxID=186058 RepID=A0AAV0GIK0_9ASTE|nr:unnamed protein product [Cuscuta epithymum]